MAGGSKSRQKKQTQCEWAGRMGNLSVPRPATTTTPRSPGMNTLVIVEHGKPATTSLRMAMKFNKHHRDVLRAVKNLECSAEFSTAQFCAVLLDQRSRQRAANGDHVAGRLQLPCDGFHRQSGPASKRTTSQSSMRWRKSSSSKPSRRRTPTGNRSALRGRACASR